jgi:hypothetical protein
MAIDIGELRGILSLQDNMSGPLSSAAKGIGVFSESFKAVTQFAGLAVGAITGATGAIVALGVRGAQISDVQDAFAGLTARAGESADVMLGALQQGTLGTISNFDLMKMANATLSTGLVKSSDDMKTLAEGAHLLADRTGGDTAEAFQTLTSAMATGRTASLKQLGLFVDSSVAAETYAKSIGKSVGDLTDHEQATARSQATLAALRSELEKSGPPVKDFGDLIDIGKVAVQNFTDNLAVAIARSPVVAAGLEAITGAVQSAFGGDQQKTIQTMIGFVNQFAIFLVKTGEVGVEVARFITNAFTGTKVIFNAVLEALFGGIGKAGDLLADLAEKAKALPVVGTLFEGVAKTMREGADQADALAIGFGEMTVKALDSAAAQNRAFDSIQSALGKTEDAMRAALTAEVDLTSGARDLGVGLAETGAAATLTAAQIKAMEDATTKAEAAMTVARDEILLAFQTLQQELTLANLTGLQQRLAEIDLARQKEIAGLQQVAFLYPEMYEQITAMVTEKYGLMSTAAVASFAEQAAASSSSGSSQIAQAEKTLAKAKKNYAEMLASGKATYAQLQAAHKAEADAEEDLDKARLDQKLAQFELLASSAASILRSIFGKSKTAAIAAAILDTLAAVSKTLAAYPWPWSLVPAAAAAALGYAQVQKIRSTEAGFAEGTPGTRFLDFGRGSMKMLHGHEAVVTKTQGESVASMVRDALGDGRSSTGGSGEIVIHNHISLGGKELRDWMSRQSRTGNLKIARDAVR